MAGLALVAATTAACSAVSPGRAARSDGSSKASAGPVAISSLLPTPAPSCAGATASGSPQAVVAAFLAARIRGAGAEGCLTASALDGYCGPRLCPVGLFHGPDAPSPGPICLYGCDGQTVRDIAIVSADLFRARISVSLSASSGPGPSEFIDNEALTLEPGTPSGSHHREPMVIVSATSSG